MTRPTIIQAFFSYSHHDEKTNPSTIAAFTTTLEDEINAKLVNARISIWRDTEKLRTGDRWDDRIQQAIEQSEVMIVLFTPRWLESEYCRKEYLLFSANEPAMGEYIAPILVRSVDRQVQNFDKKQLEIYNDIKNRQYKTMSSPNYASLLVREKNKIIANVADDIEGMIERLRQPSTKAINQLSNGQPKKSEKQSGVDAQAHNYDDVDFLSVAEILISPKISDGRKGVFAHIDFCPRMYIQVNNIRIDFAIKRAFLSIDDGGKHDLQPNYEWLSDQDSRSNHIVKLKDHPTALTICMEPFHGQNHLQELALTPSAGENRFAKVGDFRPDVQIANISAFLTVTLRAENFHIFGSDTNSKFSSASVRKITAIINALIAKEDRSAGGNVTSSIRERIKRKVDVKERGGS